MPSLAIFLHQLAATGVARNAVAIARHMADEGWRVTLVTVRSGGELAGQIGAAHHVVLGGAGLPRPVELAMSIGRLRRTIRDLAPDVLLSAGNHAHLAVAQAMRGRDMPPRVYRISNELGRPSGHAGFLRSARLRRRGMKRVVRDADRLVLVSPVLADDPALAGTLESGQAQVIINGVDVVEVRRLSLEPLPATCPHGAVPLVLAVGRLAPQKNLPRLIEAFALARRERPLRLALVGGGTAKEKAELEALAVRLGVAGDIVFVDRLRNPFPMFRAAAVLVLPSLWEGSPNVLLEGLACGTPVVASRMAGNAVQILEEGRYGLLVDPRDARQIAEAILVQVDPMRRVTGGDRAEAFDQARMLDGYKRLFEELASV